MSMPQNPLYDALRNWQRISTETLNQWRARMETLRSQWYTRFAGPQPTARIGPLRRLRMARGTRGGGRTTGARTVHRRPVMHGRVIPHASQPGYEKYDFTYSKGASKTAPFTTSKRLGMEGEPYDFSY